MGLFIVFVFGLLAVVVGILFLTKKFIKTDKQIRILFLVLPILTIICHYSSLIYHTTTPELTPLQFLVQNPNLVMPIYPCNVIMWLLLLLGIFWNQREKMFFKIVIDFSFYFGIISALIGMFVNIDFIRNPTFNDYDVMKGVFAHAFMIMNIFALGFYKVVKVDLHSNFAHLTIGVLGLGVIGLYNSLLITVFSSPEYAKAVNSMFILTAPFPDLKWLFFPTVAAIGLPLFFGAFWILDLIFHKGDSWIHREKHW